MEFFASFNLSALALRASVGPLLRFLDVFFPLEGRRKRELMRKGESKGGVKMMEGGKRSEGRGDG
jgi:hypothetical protein